MECHKCPEYWRRQELLKTLEVPTMSEAVEQLGQQLSEIIFNECPEELRKDFGLEPPLEGAGNLLWVSPSDLLIGKVCLKPPLTQKHIQALTHQGILEIGTVIEKKYWNEMEIDKQKALAEQEDLLKRMFEIRKNRLIADLQENERQKYFEQLELLRKYYERQIIEVLYDLAKDMRDQEEKLTKENEELNEKWQEKFNEEIAKTIQTMNEKLLEKLRDQENLLVDIYQKRIENAEASHRCALEFERIKCQEALMQLKHNLECRNVANLMYMLCKERRRCLRDKTSIDERYTKEKEKCQQDLKIKTNAIKRLTKLRDKKTKEINIREKCLIEIIRQYRKLINFALKSVPTQAEFLLNIHTMLKNQIDEKCFEKEIPKWMPRKVVEKKPEVETKKPPKKTSSGVLKIVKEMSSQALSVDEGRLDESDALPAFYFNNKIYVREDFRDMVLAGIRIDKHHPLWNKDVEEFINATKNIQSQQSDSVRSGYEILSKNKSHMSSVRFDPVSADSEEEIEMKKVQHEEPEEKPRPKLPPQTDQNSQSGRIPQSARARKQSIMEARDSIELVKESTFAMQRIPSSKITPQPLIGPSPTSQTSIRKKRSTKEFSDYADFTKIARANKESTVSKLTLARDSIILQISAIERKSLAKVSKLSLFKTPEVEERESHVEKEIHIEEKSSGTADILIADEQENNDDILSTASLQVHNQAKNQTTSKLLLASDSLELLKSSCRVGLLSDKVEPSPSEAKSVTKAPSKKKISRTQMKRATKAGTNQKPKAHIAGDKTGKEHLQSPKEFTNERINSLINLIKDDPSLIRLFTACSK